MSAEYAPGLYAVDSWRGRGLWAFRANRGGENRWCVYDDGDTRGLSDAEVTDVRPLVVLDLDLAAHIGVSALVADLRTSGFYDIADQIEAQTKPPKPAEPTGLGAVVEDAEGNRWVRAWGHLVAGRVWTQGLTVGAETIFRGYDSITAVRVVSEGVTA